MFELRVDKVIERPATVSSQPISSLPTRPITPQDEEIEYVVPGIQANLPLEYT